MADTKVSALDAIVSAADGDNLYIVDDPGGTPLSRKITVANLLKVCLYLADILDEDDMVSDDDTYPPTQQSVKAYVDGLIADQLALAGGTMAGDIAMADNTIGRPVLEDYGETVNTVASSGSTETLDLEDGNVHDVTLDDDCTFTFSNPPASGTAGSFTLILRQDAGGGNSTTWPASVDWAGGTAPTLSTDGSAVDVLTFLTVDGGTTWLGFAAGLDMQSPA